MKKSQKRELFPTRNSADLYPKTDRGQYKSVECTKRVFGSLDEARKACAHFWLKEGRKLWPYRCKQCSMWHMTSKDPSEQIRRGLSTVLK